MTSSKDRPAEEADAAAGGAGGGTLKQQLPLSRREKRKLLNAKHAAPQFPRIQNPKQRAKAYVRASGLTNDTASSIKSLDEAEIHLGRQLGAPDERTRHQTVLKLKAYIKARTEPTAAGLSEWDLLKLCKCLWYCLYMADRVPVQQELSKHLSSLVWCCEGTEEQDECAATTYMEMCGDEDDYDEEEDGDQFNQDGDEDEDEDEEVVMEELENTLDNMEENSIDDDDNESESFASGADSSTDDEAKQEALLLEQDEEEDDEEEEDYRSVGHCRGAHLAALFVRCWYRTIVREWTQMDKYRIDKFYSLLRDLLQVVYQYMARRNWNLGLIRLFNDVLHEEILTKTPNGVRYHMIDICVEELAKVVHRKDSPIVTEAIFLDVLEPFFALAQTGGGGGDSGGDDTVQRRVIEHVLEKFLYKYSVFRNTENDNGDDTEDDKPIFDQVHVGTVANFIFEVGGSDGVKNASYRKDLYGVYKKYVKRIKKVGEDKDVDIEGNETDDDDDDSEDGNQSHCHDHASQQKGNKAANDCACCDEENTTDPPEVAPSAKKAKKQRAEKAVLTPVPEPDQSEEPLSTPKIKKTKKKKNKKKQAMNHETVDGGKTEDSISGLQTDIIPAEEEVTISFADQKAAQKKLRLVPPKTPQGSGGDDKETAANNKKRHRRAEMATAANERKRVKFGSKNVARSWQASMKGLRTMESPVTDVKPEESILRNKTAKPSTVKQHSSRRSRKKASEYF